MTCIDALHCTNNLHDCAYKCQECAIATLQSTVTLFLKSPAGCQRWSRGSPQTKEHTLGNPGTPQCHAPHGLTVPRHTQHAPVDRDKGNS